MSALLRLEFKVSFVWWSLLALLQGVFVLMPDVQDFWVHPEDEQYELLFGLWLIPPFVIGLAGFGTAGFGVDVWRGTREFLLHRGVSRDALFLGRVTSGLLHAVAWVLLGVLVPFCLLRLFSSQGALVTTHALVRYLVIGSIAVSGYAAGALVGSLRCRRSAQLVFGVWTLVALGRGSLAILEPGPEEWAGSLGTYALAQLVAASLALCAARHNFQRPHDPDRPVPLRAQVAQVTATGVAVVAFVLFVVPRFQEGVYEEYFWGGYPEIGRRADGELGLYLAADDSGHYAVDASHQRGDRLASVESIWKPFEIWASTREQSAQRRLDGQRVWMRDDIHPGQFLDPIGFSGFERAYLARPAGVIHAFFHPYDGREWRDNVSRQVAEPRAASSRILTRPDGTRFSTQTHACGVDGPLGARDGRVFLGDPEDGSVWAYSFGDPGAEIEALPLPEGDRYVRWVWDPDRTEERGATSDFVVVGEHGLWHRVDDAWAAYGGELPAVEDEPPAFRAEVTPGRSPIEFGVEVYSAQTGAVVFSHQYAPRTWMERGLALSLGGLALFRPPIALLSGFLGDVPDHPAHRDRFRFAWFRDPLVRGGAGIGLLLAHLLLTALCGGLVLVALARRRVEPGRMALWGIAIALGGWSIAWLFWAFEPASAWREAPAPVAEEPPPMLIVSR